MTSLLRSRVVVMALGAALAGGVLVTPALVASGGPAGAAEPCASPSPSGQPNPIESIIGGLPIPGDSASPSPSATPTASTSPSPSASGSSSPTPCPSGSPQGCPGQPLTVRVNTPTINATGNASVSVTGATPTA